MGTPENGSAVNLEKDKIADKESQCNAFTRFWRYHWDDRAAPTAVLSAFVLSFILPDSMSRIFLSIVGILMIAWFLSCIIDFSAKKDPKRIKQNVVGLFRFAYVFTILSIVFLMLPFSPFKVTPSVTSTVSGISVFRGCLALPATAQLPPNNRTQKTTVYALGTPLVPECARADESSASIGHGSLRNASGTSNGLKTEATANGVDVSSPADPVVATSGASAPDAAGVSSMGRAVIRHAESFVWLLSIGGVAGQLARSSDNAEAPSVRVEDGLVIPLSVILVAIMGAAVSLSRRLPEYQRQARLDDETHEGPTLSLTEAKEKVVFELMQLISAPLIVIAAFAAVSPSSPGVAIVLAFATGFASESILCLIRSVTDGLKPISNTKPQSRSDETGKEQQPAQGAKAKEKQSATDAPGKQPLTPDV